MSGTNTFVPVGSMANARASHTATLLTDGEVLVAGGTSGTLGILASAELYNPASRAFANTGSMADARSGAAAALLKDGRVLVTGGAGVGGVLASAELYGPGAGKFTSTANPMPEPHFEHAIALLANGQVLVAGGFAGEGSDYFLETEAAATLFDPITDSFASATPLNIPRSRISAEVLEDGRVFIPGGANFQGEQLADAELYTPGAGGGFDVSGGLHSERVDHKALALTGGQILITGGINGSGQVSSSAELYDPATQRLTLTKTPMTTARSGHTMTMLNSGMVLVAGGGTDTAELYDPAAGTFAATAGKMTAVRLHHTATLLNDGTVLIAGGVPNEASPSLQTAELYNPTTNSFTPVAALMQSPRVYHVAALLPDGKVLLAGGSDAEDNSGGATDTAEIYDPGNQTFTATTNTMSAQRYAAADAVLTGGSVLIVDGGSSTTPTPSADIYNPATGMFSPTTGPPTAVRFFHSVALLADGTVLVAGGANSIAPLNSSEIYDPTAGTFTPGLSMVYQRSQFTATALSGDTGVLIAGGVGTNGFALPSTELFCALMPRGDAAVDHQFGAGTMPASSEQRYTAPQAISSGVAARLSGASSASAFFASSGSADAVEVMVKPG